MNVAISSMDFFLVDAAGIVAFSAGCPTTNRRKGRWFFGWSKISLRNFIGLGVCVRVASPAACSAFIRKPVAIPTDSVM